MFNEMLASAGSGEKKHQEIYFYAVYSSSTYNIYTHISKYSDNGEFTLATAYQYTVTLQTPCKVTAYYSGTSYIDGEERPSGQTIGYSYDTGLKNVKLALIILEEL